MKQSQKKDGRLTLKSDFTEVRESSEKQVCFLAVMLYTEAAADDPEPQARCGVICSRRFDKRAVYRNRARRLLFEAFRLKKQDLIPCRIIFIPRRPILNLKMQDVAHQLEKLFRRAGLFRSSRT